MLRDILRKVAFYQIISSIKNERQNKLEISNVLLAILSLIMITLSVLDIMRINHLHYDYQIMLYKVNTKIQFFYIFVLLQELVTQCCNIGHLYRISTNYNNINTVVMCVHAGYIFLCQTILLCLKPCFFFFCCWC